jgi:hypothetical protein
MSMGSDPKAYLTLARCGSHTEITASQFAALSALPDPVGPITRCFVCDLAGGHADGHVAFAVASDGGDKWWWVRWGREWHVVVQIDPCEVAEPKLPALEFCLFPAGHPGPHSCDVLPPARNVVNGPLD